MFYLEWLEEFIKHRDRPTIRIKGKTEQDYDGYDDSDMKDPPTMHDLDFERTKSTAESPPDTPCSYSEHITAEPASKKWRMVSTADDGEGSINEGAPSHSKSLNVQSTTSWPQAAITDSGNRHELSVPMPQQAENTNKRLLSRSDDDTYANSRKRNDRFTSLKRKNSTVENSTSSQDEFDLFGQYVALKMRKLHSRLSSEQLEDLEFDILNTIERTRRQNRQVENGANTTGVDEGHFNGQHD
uniref:Uncharacterized protein n=1 Tax=Clytia hemisphaerica TaxID=252671 RepID=A0A7M5V6M4_9CNID